MDDALLSSHCEMNLWFIEWVDGWIEGRMNGWMDGRIEGCMNVWLDGLRVGWMWQSQTLKWIKNDSFIDLLALG